LSRCADRGTKGEPHVKEGNPGGGSQLMSPRDIRDEGVSGRRVGGRGFDIRSREKTLTGKKRKGRAGGGDRGKRTTFFGVMNSGTGGNQGNGGGRAEELKRCGYVVEQEYQDGGKKKIAGGALTNEIRSVWT